MRSVACEELAYRGFAFLEHDAFVQRPVVWRCGEGVLGHGALRLTV